jgi:hypothetical protein
LQDKQLKQPPAVKQYKIFQFSVPVLNITDKIGPKKSNNQTFFFGHRSCLIVSYTVLRARIKCLKKVHPAKWARAQELYIVSSYTYAFDETFTCIWIFLWSVSLEWQEAHLDDGFTQTIPPPASSLIFK